MQKENDEKLYPSVTIFEIDQIEGLSKQLKTNISTMFTKALNEDDFENCDKIINAYEKYKKGYEKLEKARQLGSLIVGDKGQKDFGSFRLVWTVQSDNIEWSLNEIEDPQKSWLTGALKYVGWNRIEITSEMSLEEQLQNKQSNFLAAAPNFEVYVHEWSALKKALDFLYYDLGRKSAKGTYEDGFIKQY